MAKKGPSAYMTTLEKGFGGALLALYLIVLPFLSAPLFQGLETLLGFRLTERTRGLLWCGVLLALTLAVFWSYIGRTTRLFFSGAPSALLTTLQGLVAFYGVNELGCRVLGTVGISCTDLSRAVISAQVGDMPRTTLLLSVLLVPFVEEVLFRGYVFGCLRNRSRPAAYLVSCTLFAALYVWRFAVADPGPESFWLMLQYLIPGAVFAWCYERSGTLWAGILAHVAVNALAVWG